MKKIVLSLMVGLAAISAWSQSSMDDQAAKIALTPIVSEGLKVPADARAALETKLMQIVSRNGLGSTSGTFVITPNLVMISKETTATAPAQFVVAAEVVLFVVEPTSKTVVSQIAIPVRGVAPMENKAYLQAINSMSPNSGTLKKFIDGSRLKIVEYYNGLLPTIISRAEMLIAKDQYDEAMVLLLDIPEQVEGFDKVASMVSDVYKKKINRHGAEVLKNAEISFADDDYAGALQHLRAVDPYSDAAVKASAMVTKIKAIKDDEKAQALALEMKKYEAAQAEAANRYQRSSSSSAKGAAAKGASYSPEAITNAARAASKDLIGASAEASKPAMQEAVNQWSSTLFGQ